MARLRHQPPYPLLVALLVGLMPFAGGCELLGVGNPTPGAKPSRFGEVWIRHRKDDYDREAYVVVGFTLTDRANEAIAADGKIDVELKWKVGMMEWTAEGSADVRAGSFRRAEGKPVRDGTWYVEPWSMNLIGAQYPGPSKHGYDASIKFTSAEGKTLTWRRWMNVER